MLLTLKFSASGTTVTDCHDYYRIYCTVQYITRRRDFRPDALYFSRPGGVGVRSFLLQATLCINSMVRNHVVTSKTFLPSVLYISRRFMSYKLATLQ